MLDDFSSYLKRYMKYAYEKTAFDSTSLVEGTADVAYDGYDSLMNKVILSYNLAYYDFSKGMF